MTVTTVKGEGEGDDACEEAGEVFVGARVDDADDGGDVAEGINDAKDGGKVVCPDTNTAHTPAKTTVSNINQSCTVCSC